MLGDGYKLWSNWFSNAIIFVAVQRIAICYLRRKELNHSLYLDAQSTVGMTADLENSRQIKKAIAKLNIAIHRGWEQDLDCRFPLTYWLAVDISGLVIACNAVNQVSQDNFKFTPLSELIDSADSESAPTAKLEVVFNAPVFVDIKPLSGISTPILTIIMLS